MKRLRKQKYRKSLSEQEQSASLSRRRKRYRLKCNIKELQKVSPEDTIIYENSSVRKALSKIRNCYGKKPSFLLSVIAHVVKQFCRNPAYHMVLQKEMGSNVQSKSKRPGKVGKYLVEIGKLRSRKQFAKIPPVVSKIKKDFSSLRQASKVSGMTWSTFHRLCNVHTGKKAEKKLPIVGNYLKN